MRFNCVAKVKSAFRTGSPASNDGALLLDFWVRICMISEAACTKKSVRLKAGNSMEWGKNSTVSHALICLVLGK